MTSYEWTAPDGVRYEIERKTRGRYGAHEYQSNARDSDIMAELLTLAEKWQAAAERAKELAEAGSIVVQGFEDGVFVRDTAGDDRPDLAMKLLRFVNGLGKLARLSKENP